MLQRMQEAINTIYSNNNYRVIYAQFRSLQEVLCFLLNFPDQLLFSPSLYFNYFV